MEGKSFQKFYGHVDTISEGQAKPADRNTHTIGRYFFHHVQYFNALEDQFWVSWSMQDNLDLL